MAVSYKRTNIGEGINLNEIYDPKFKSDRIKISFVTALEKKNEEANAILGTVLVTSNSEFRNRTELADKLAELYGTTLVAGFSRVGNYQRLDFAVSFIGDKYTIGGEKISTEAVRQLLNCIFRPDIADGKFNESYFRLRKQELIDNLKSSVNDKRSYGYMQAESYIFEGEPCAVSAKEEIEYAQKVTQEDLLRQLEYLKKSAAIEISVCGGGETAEAVETVKRKILSLERENVEKISYRCNSRLKDEVIEVTEEMNVNQCKMYMAYKSECRDIYVCKVFQCLLGCTPFSKLFSNVREKLSLCYYCTAAYRDLKGTLIIDSGVEEQNIQKAKEAIEEQLDAIRAGDFTDGELYNTKLYMCGLFKSNYDSAVDTMSWFETQNTRGTSYTPEQQSELVMNVTREQVIECAKSFKPDTVYILKNSGEVCENE